MPAPKRKPKAPSPQPDKTGVAGQPLTTIAATPAPVTPDLAPSALSLPAAAAPLNHAQLRRLRSKLKQKYHA